MPISRRSLLRSLGATAIAGVTVPSRGAPSVAQVPSSSQGRSQLPYPVFLDHNENAYGPSEKVLDVLRNAVPLSSRYPRAEYDDLLSKLAALHAVKPEQIVLTCGSSEILQLAAATFLGPGKKLLQAAPTYPTLGRFAQSNGVGVVDVPLNKMYAHDLEAMLARSGDATGLVYICNPNNPTGTLTPRRDIEAFIRKLPGRTTVLIDEAYHHYVSPSASYVSFLDSPLDDTRVVVCRTFSKVYGLAGLRVGYAVTTPDLARRLSASRLRYGVSVISAKAAAAAVDDADYVRLTIKRNADDRQEFANQVNARMLRCLDSHANFVLVNPMHPVDMVIDHLKKNNVLVAPRVTMDKYVRVSLGTPPELQEFWRVFDMLPPGSMAM